MRVQFDWAAWGESVAHAAMEVGTGLASAFASLVVVLLTIAVAWSLSYVVTLAVRSVFRVVDFDRISARLAPSGVLEHAGIRLPPSQMLTTLVFWVVFLSCVTLSVEAFGLTLITTAFDYVLSYVPSLVRAGMVVLFGLLIARFVGAVVTSMATTGGLQRAERVGFLAQLLVTGLVLVIAVEQLGLPAAMLIAPATALVATLGIAGGLAFALGARPIVTHILAGHFLRTSLPRNVFVEVGGERGVVERVGSTDTLLRNDDKRWSVPNARLLEEVVVR